MKETVAEKLQEVVAFRHEPPAQILAQVFEIGVGRLWEETVLAQYLKKQISRRKAVQLVGHDLVQLAEEQQRIVHEDITWGLKTATSRR